MSQNPEILQILSGLETGLAELRLQNQLITNQLYDVLQALGSNSKISAPDINKQSEPIPKESLTTELSLEIKDIVRIIVKEELSAVEAIFREEFNKIDMTLGKFFQKVVSDNKLVIDMIKQVQESQINISTLQQQLIPTLTSLATASEQSLKVQSPSLSVSPSSLPQEKLSHYQVSTSEDSMETSKTVTSSPGSTTDAEARALTSKPRKFIDSSIEQPIPKESSSVKEEVLKEQAPSTTRISKPTQISYTDPDTASDIENITNMITFFQKGDIPPKDAIDKLESLRDLILFDRKKEAPYRVTASRILREVLSDLNRERNRHTLTDGLQTQVIKLLATLLSHIESS